MKAILTIITALALLLGCASTPQDIPATSVAELGQRAAQGDLNAMDEIQRLHAEARKEFPIESKEFQSHTREVRSTLDFIAEAVRGNSRKDPAFQSLLHATGKLGLRGFIANAFGIAAARGHEPSLEVLLNHDEYGILLSSAVFGLQGPAESGNNRAIRFLISVIQDDSKKPLWFGASQGLVASSLEGNEEAKAALRKYSEYNKERLKKQGD